MNKFFIALAATLISSTTVNSNVAFADSSEAEACLRAKGWDNYEQGWALRSMSTDTMTKGDFSSYKVTFYGGREYKISTCGDVNFKKLGLHLYNLNGKPVESAGSNGREPFLSYTPKQTETMFIVVQANKMTSDKGGTALAVFYK